ncbi:DUF5994 family protein, partial [Streptomyces sp. NPDC057748]
MEEPWGRVTGVTMNPTRWPVVPHTVAVDGRALRVGWFTEQDPDKRATPRRWSLSPTRESGAWNPRRKGRPRACFESSVVCPEGRPGGVRCVRSQGGGSPR